MRFLYQFGILIAAVPWLTVYVLPRLIKGKYRKGISERFGLYPDEIRRIADGRPIWIHAVSVGEIISITPLVISLKEKFPNVPIVVSTITETGREVAIRMGKADAVVYFPVDLRSCIKRALTIVNPRLIMIAETEFWLNFIWQAGEAKIPLFLINGRISDRSYRKYNWIRPLLRNAFRSFTGFFMQSDLDAKRIISLGAPKEKVTISGNIKYDRYIKKISQEEIEDVKKSLPFNESEKIFIAGSTHRGEEEIIVNVLARLRNKHPSLKLIIAPRHPERTDEVEEILKKYKFNWKRRSIEDDTEDVDVLIIDTVGELSKIYAVGKIIFIGGSLISHGGHNPIEAAIFEKPVITGPYINNFRDVYEHLLNSQAAMIVRNGDELYEAVSFLLENEDKLLRMGNTAKKCIEERMGVVNRIVDSIEKFVSQ